MAELNIERKERSAWPWLLLGALLVALVLWFVFGMADDDAELATADTTAGAMATTPATVAEPADAAVPAAVTAFEQFAQTGAAAGADVGVAHQYTSEGLRHLADALAAVTERETVSGTVDVSERLAEIRDRADQMQREPTSSQHALQAREATLLAAALMRQLGGTEGDAGTQAQAAYTTAESIAPDTPLLDQIETVRRFFDQSAATLRSLATR